MVSPDYLAVRTVILRALEDHPVIRAQVSAALMAHEAKGITDETDGEPT
jgi:hypothetical protein